MIKRESSSSILFRHWLRANPQETCSYEMKDTRGKDYLNFSEVKDEQLNYGLAIHGEKGVLIRVEAIQTGLPDYVYLRSVPSYIVIKYPKFIAIIDVKDFLKEKNRSKRKSLTSDLAIHIAYKVLASRKTPLL